MASTEVVRPRRGRQTIGDMTRSLGLMAIVVAAVLLLGPARSLLFPGADRMPAVDFSYQVRTFASLAGVGAMTPPADLPGWRATSAYFTRPHGTVRLHIGWAVPGNRYAGFDEATGDAAALVRSVLGARGATVVQTVRIDGAAWARRLSSRGEAAFSRTVGGVTVVVTGDASDAQLRRLVGSLR